MKHDRFQQHFAGLQWLWQITYAATADLWITLLVSLQSIAVEEFEYYAVYESNCWDVATSFLMFKPVEVLCEAVLGLIAQRRSRSYPLG